MKKIEPNFLVAMSPDMIKLYSMVKTFSICDFKGKNTPNGNCYRIYPHRKNQIPQIEMLLATMGVQKFGEIQIYEKVPKTVILIPYKTCTIVLHKIAMENIINAFRRMDSLNFIMDHGGMNLSAAEEKYFYKKAHSNEKKR